MAWLLLLGGALLLSGCDETPEVEEPPADGGGTGAGGGALDDDGVLDDEVADGGGAEAVYKRYYVKTDGDDGNAGTATEPLATVTKALEKLAADYAAASPAWPNEESGQIVILGTVNAKLIDITGTGYPHIVLAGGSGAAAGTLALSEAAANYLLMVNDGASVSLRNITLKGWNTGSAAGFVRVGNTGTATADGTLRLESGAAVKDNNTGGTYGSGVAVYHGHFIMEEGSEISGNTAGNGSVGYGGGMYVYNGGTFTMNGGTIKGNTAGNGSVGYAGGVYVNGVFTMNGGTIKGNTAGNGGKGFGGGVYAGGVVGVFTMTGGTISGNTATYGGGVCVDNATFSKTGGTIYGNNETDTGLKNTATDGDSHAVLASGSGFSRKRDTTAGPDVGLNSANGDNWE
jgi:hypothetical protein